MAPILASLIRGEPLSDVLSRTYGPFCPGVQKVMDGSYRGRARNDIRFSGYVIHTFEASLWYVNEKTTFRDAVLLAVNLEDDADTVGAVTGQIAGTAYNLSTIPREWANRLSRNERLVEVADRLSLACLG